MSLVPRRVRLLKIAMGNNLGFDRLLNGFSRWTVINYSHSLRPLIFLLFFQLSYILPFPVFSFSFCHDPFECTHTDKKQLAILHRVIMRNQACAISSTPFCLPTRACFYCIVFVTLLLPFYRVSVRLNRRLSCCKYQTKQMAKVLISDACIVKTRPSVFWIGLVPEK